MRTRFILHGHTSKKLPSRVSAHQKPGLFFWFFTELYAVFPYCLVSFEKDNAQNYLVGRTQKHHDGFPAFWAPNYDWIPDQDHGGILMKALQAMVLQVNPYSEKI